MDDWAFWLVLAAVLGVAEVLTLTLFLGLVALAALAAGLVALLGSGLVAQLLAFIVASLVLTVVVRPALARVLPDRRHHRSGVEALKGSPATVLERTDGRDGRIKLAGEVWSARTMEGVPALEPGTPVQVVQIEGATAVVFPAAELT